MALISLETGEARDDGGEAIRVASVDFEVGDAEALAALEETVDKLFGVADEKVGRGEQLLWGDAVVRSELSGDVDWTVGDDGAEGDRGELQLIEAVTGAFADPADLLGHQPRRAGEPVVAATRESLGDETDDVGLTAGQPQ